jgi:ubiquinone/menaquinone biosynthesis C-methylase UbiE
MSSGVRGRASERMSDASFQFMCFAFDVLDFLFPHIHARVKGFGLREGMTVVDYGCGPGRYTARFSKLVGATGKVYAVDIHEMAIEAVKRKIAERGWQNVAPVLASGYNSGIPDHVADVVCAIDMFFIIKNPTEFLGELKRIAKKDGMLIIDDGHQSRDVTKKSLLASGHWTIEQETRDHLKCTPS